MFDKTLSSYPSDLLLLVSKFVPSACEASGARREILRIETPEHNQQAVLSCPGQGVIFLWSRDWSPVVQVARVPPSVLTQIRASGRSRSVRQEGILVFPEPAKGLGLL